MNLLQDRKVKKLAYLPEYWLDVAQIWCRGVFLDSKSDDLFNCLSRFIIRLFQVKSISCKTVSGVSNRPIFDVVTT